MSIARLSEALGCTPPAICNMEHGAKAPGWPLLADWCGALKIPLDENMTRLWVLAKRNVSFKVDAKAPWKIELLSLLILVWGSLDQYAGKAIVSSARSILGWPEKRTNQG